EGTEAGEIVSCPDCSTNLEVTNVAPPVVQRAPEVEEDWGE
ncbi:MAG: lysine biosynthesis protein LysW, partial [bacterium]|nr:lysine biosynthesis protein LysW [bacterium]